MIRYVVVQIGTCLVIRFLLDTDGGLDLLHEKAVLVAYPELESAPMFAAGMSAGGGVAPGFAQGKYRDLFAGVAVFSNNATAIAGLDPQDETGEITAESRSATVVRIWPAFVQR